MSMAMPDMEQYVTATGHRRGGFFLDGLATVKGYVITFILL